MYRTEGCDNMITSFLLSITHLISITRLISRSPKDTFRTLTKTSKLVFSSALHFYDTLLEPECEAMVTSGVSCQLYERHRLQQSRGWVCVSINLQWARQNFIPCFSRFHHHGAVGRPNQYPIHDRLGRASPPIPLLRSKSTSFQNRPNLGRFLFSPY